MQFQAVYTKPKVSKAFANKERNLAKDVVNLYVTLFS